MNWIAPRKRKAIYDRDGHRCVYCGGNGDDSRLTLDHLIPVDLGGTNEAKNLVTCCLGCNSAKSSKTMKQFMKVLKDKGVDVEELKKRIRKQSRKKLDYNERMRRKP